MKKLMIQIVSLSFLIFLSICFLFPLTALASEWEKHYNDASSYYSKGDRLSTSHSLGMAYRAARDEKSVSGLLKVAEFYNRINSKVEAKTCLRDAEEIAEEKKDRNAMGDIARIYRVLGEELQAKSCFDKAESFTAAAGGDGITYLRQAREYFTSGKRIDALNSLHKAEKSAIEKQNYSLLMEIAKSYKYMGNETEMISSMRQAEKIALSKRDSKRYAGDSRYIQISWQEFRFPELYKTGRVVLIIIKRIVFPISFTSQKLL